MKHHCHALGCRVEVPPRLLMCPAHWRQVPKTLQEAVLSTYRRGQCDDKSPSRAWFYAAKAAIEAVRELDASAEPEEGGK